MGGKLQDNSAYVSKLIEGLAISLTPIPAKALEEALKTLPSKYKCLPEIWEFNRRLARL